MYAISLGVKDFKTVRKIIEITLEERENKLPVTMQNIIFRHHFE